MLTEILKEVFVVFLAGFITTRIPILKVFVLKNWWIIPYTLVMIPLAQIPFWLGWFPIQGIQGGKNQVYFDQVFQEIETQQTGQNQVYEISIANDEVIVGHGNKFLDFQNGNGEKEGCVAFLITGPGVANFSLENGIWYRWKNSTPESSEMLLQEQISTLFRSYSCRDFNIVRTRLE